MTTNFPLGLDIFINPSGSDHQDGPPGTTHADQHTNINDAVKALQNRVGVTGSAVPSTIDYELHNIEHGHDHDGINSRPIKLGTSGSVTGSGYFTISPSSSMGETVFNINIALLDLSNSINNISASQIAFESQTVELTPKAVRVNLTGSGVSGSVSSSMAGDVVTYTIPGADIDYRQIQFLRESGPFEPFGPSMYHSFSYGPIPFVSYSVWYTDFTKTKIIFDTEYTDRNFRRQAQKIIYKVYNVDGISVKSTVTDIVTYSGVIETTRIRTVT